MKISRHAIDMERVRTVFEFWRTRTGKEIEGARQAPRGLSLLFNHAETIFIAGGVINPNLTDVREALKLAVQAGAAIFTCQGPSVPPPFELGEGTIVAYSESVSRSFADYPTWLKVYHLCLITRQHRLSDATSAVPNKVFHGSDIIGAETEDYTFADMLRAVWTKERFTEEPAFDRTEVTCRSQPKSAKYVHRVTIPYLRALRHLEGQESELFAQALVEALEGHKAYYSTKKNSTEFNGFFSLMLTAVAALAWDRGLRFDVESDYAPRSWVTGELFRQESHPG